MEESYDFSLGCPSSTSTTLERYQIEQMSRFCLNGSLSHLSTDQWKDLCLPYYKDEVGFDKIAGTFGVLTFIVGVIGNLFTLVAVPFAKYKHRHDFHRSFWTTDIWIVHLAFCDIIWCVLTLPYCFLIPSFGSHNYPQWIGCILQKFFHYWLCNHGSGLVTYGYHRHDTCHQNQVPRQLEDILWT